MEPNPVEMQQVVIEIASHAAALSGLELSSTSNSGRSSSNSSPQSSARTTISISSPNLSDHSSPIDAPAGNASASVRAPTRFLPRAQAMASLQEGAYPLILQNLQKSEKDHQKDASTNKKQVRRLSKEIYVIVSMYALLQGALFVAVAQSSASAFMCEDWWGPAVMAGGVAVGTLWGVVDKLRQMGNHKAKAKKSERCQSAVYSKIQLLYSYGNGCPIDGNLEPQGSSRELPSCSALLCLRGLLVLGFLVGFSLLNIASCTCMLCHSNSQKL